MSVGRVTEPPHDFYQFPALVRMFGRNQFLSPSLGGYKSQMEFCPYNVPNFGEDTPLGCVPTKYAN